MKNKMFYILLGAGITCMFLFTIFVMMRSTATAQPNQPEELVLSQTTELTDDAPMAEVVVNTEPNVPVVVENVEDTVESPPLYSGSRDKPEEDVQKIETAVNTLYTLQSNNILGQAGWFHVASRLYVHNPVSDGLSSPDGELFIPHEQLVPKEALFETWFRIDETGRYEEVLTLTRGQDGKIHQLSLLQDGQMSL